MVQKVGGVEFDVEVGTNGAISASKKIASANESVENSFNQVDAAADRAGDGMERSAKRGAKGMGNMRNAAGQLGFQVQDMAVQLQSGTNAMVVLGQQGSQVASIFGPTGAIVGGVIAVGAALAGVLAPSLMDSGKEAEELTEKLKELQKENELTENQLAFLEQQQRKETEAKKEKIKELDEEIKKLEDVAKNGDVYNQFLLNARAANLGFAADIAGKVIPTLEEQREKLVELKAERDLLAGAKGEETFDLEANKKAIKSYQDRIMSIQSAVEQENQVIFNAIQRRVQIESGYYSQAEAMQRENEQNQLARAEAALQTKLTQFQNERESVLENEALTENQRQALLDEYRMLELQTISNHEERKKEIEKSAAEERRKIAEQEYKDKLSLASKAFGNLSSLMNTESRKMFEIGKAAAIAGAIVDGIAAVQGAYKTGAKIGGPPLGAAFAATAAAATAANISQIKNTQFGSAGTGQSIQGGVVTNNTQQAPQQPDRNISIALTGSNFSGSDVRALIEQINDELGDGATLSATGG